MPEPQNAFGTENLRFRNDGKAAYIGTRPLIFLHVASQLSLLPAFYPIVRTTSEVVEEVLSHRAEGLDAPDPYSLSWLKVITVDSPTGDLPAGIGQTNHTLLWEAARAGNSISIVEGRHVRRVAQQMKCATTGTVGILLMAHQEGMLTSVADILLQLRGTGFPFSLRMLTSTLLLSGESHRLRELAPLAG